MCQRRDNALTSWREGAIPNLKVELDKLLSSAADHEMIVREDDRSEEGAEGRRRVEQFQALANQIRSQITECPSEEAEFLLEQAAR